MSGSDGPQRSKKKGFVTSTRDGRCAETKELQLEELFGGFIATF